MKTFSQQEVFDMIQELIYDNFRVLETTKEGFNFKFGIIDSNDRIIKLQEKIHNSK